MFHMFLALIFQIKLNANPIFSAPKFVSFFFFVSNFRNHPFCVNKPWWVSDIIQPFYMRFCSGVHEKNQYHFIIKDITDVMRTFIKFVIQASVM